MIGAGPGAAPAAAVLFLDSVQAELEQASGVLEVEPRDLVELLTPEEVAELAATDGEGRQPGRARIRASASAANALALEPRGQAVRGCTAGGAQTHLASMPP
jgi:hypothetical protein